MFDPVTHGPAASHPDQAFNAFADDLLRAYAGSFGRSFEQMTQDWRETLHSHARIARAERMRRGLR